MSRRIAPEVNILKFFEMADLGTAVAVLNIAKEKVATRVASEQVGSAAPPTRRRVTRRRAKAAVETEADVSPV